MRIIFSFTLLLIFCHSFQVTVYAQSGIQFDPLKDEISNKILPLEMLIDSGIANNASIHVRDLQILVNRCRLKTNRVDWTKNIGMQADLRYGNFYSYSTNSTSGIEPPAVATISNEIRYGAALYVKFPLYDFVNRKTQLKLASVEIEQAQGMAEMQRYELRQLIIRQYNDLVLKQRLLRLKNKSLVTSNINMQMADKEFSNGIIPLSEYARISEIVLRSESDYENARMDFMTAYMILEEIVGIKFNLIKTTAGSDEGN